MRLTIAKRVFLGFAICILITAGLGIFTYMRVALINHEVDQIAHESLPGLANSAGIDNGIGENYALLLEHIIAQDASRMKAVEDRMDRTVDRVTEYFKAYEQTITLNEDRQMFLSVQNARAQWLTARNAVFVLSQQMKKQEAIELFYSQAVPAYTELDDAVVKMSEWNKEHGDEYVNEGQAAVESAETGIIVGVGVVLIVGIG
jgi:methyl-accepting chemotaxis protein